MVIGALTLFIQAWRTGRITKDTNAKATQIDHAVNGKGPDATTMVSQVQEMHDKDFPIVTDDDAVLPLLRRVAVALEMQRKENGNGE